jgi:protein phosphatase
VGLRRANNQDSFAVVLADNQSDFQQRGHFFMVADGMGAHAAGELASKMAIDTVAMVYRKRLEQPPTEAILSALLDANRHIHSRGQASLDFRGMGTTATALVLLPAGAIVAHVGDSRAYRLRGTQIEQLTFDHSLVWEIRAASQSPNAELPTHISKNIITRSLGPSPSVQIDIEGILPIQPGDTFLLCSDGLSGQVNDDEIGMILSCLPPAEAVQALVNMANLRGGPDNITVVVARVLGPQIAQNTQSSPDDTTPSNIRPVHPFVWTLAGVTFLSGAGMLTLGCYWMAILAFLVAAGALIAALVQRYSGSERDYQQEEQHFGRGPYVTCDCTINADLLARLTNIAQQLRDSATTEAHEIDMTEFDRLSSEAASAANPTDAARDNLRAINDLMAKLCKARNASSNSTGEL